MKKLFIFSAMMLTATAALAKDIKTVVLTTNPEMHCNNCEKKIKSNLRFEKGVKVIETDLRTKTVTIKYDADHQGLQENQVRGKGGKEHSQEGRKHSRFRQEIRIIQPLHPEQRDLPT